jgi:ribosomal protein S18 acetylase RimI-like enzyme
MGTTIRNIYPEDYDIINDFWRKIDGIELTELEDKQNFEFFLRRNEGMSFLAVDHEELIGTCLGSHNGRRGFLNHLAVAQNHRRKGIGKMLVQKCLEILQAEGIKKIYIFLTKENVEAQSFWEHIGWSQYDQYLMMTVETGPRGRL